MSPRDSIVNKRASGTERSPNSSPVSEPLWDVPDLCLQLKVARSTVYD
jgi:hypothetical protein